MGKHETIPQEFDLIVVGAGAGGMTTALVGACEGLRTLVLERTAEVGGTTALSGGMVWIPNTQLARDAGFTDSPDAVRAYLDALVPEHRADPRMDAFLASGAEAIRYLRDRTEVRFQPVRRYPDYYPDIAGATLGGRVLEPVPFDATVLGDAFRHLKAPLPEFTLFGGMMVAREDIPAFRKVFRSPTAAWRVLHLAGRYVLQRLRHHRGTSLVLGNALAARLFHAGRQRGVRYALETPVRRLVMEDGRCVGVDVHMGGEERRLRSAAGVVLATGGFSHDPEFRALLVPQPGTHIPATAATADGSGLRLGRAAGAAMAGTERDAAFWVPVSRFRTAAGREVVYPHTVTDRAKPGVIAVDGSGRRFVNECVSYHEFGRAMARGHNAGGARVFLLTDARGLWTYGLGAVKPFTLATGPYVQAGYLLRGDSVPELAVRLGIDPVALAATVARFNASAVRGEDPEFRRGCDAYQRHLGDADVTPNPNVAPLATPPFYAVELYHGDLGTAAGLATDVDGRVLDAQGAPIAGLYAVGNDAHSIMHGSYPGPGITLGPALVFGYRAGLAIAASHARAGVVA